MTIQILPDEVASQIAAGEVVERPASVVKELVENALDAGATSITVRVEGAGKKLIEVGDDGCGIALGEMQIALARHATSKLRTADELFHITSLGFRGEALASIASVSRMTLSSRTSDEEAGARLVVEGGKERNFEPIGAITGTTVRVEDLFLTVPARLKFLKTDSTERTQIDNLVARYSLAYPHVRFQLEQDGHTALLTPGNGDRREVLANLYGVDLARQMIEVLLQDDGLELTGYISPISITRGTRRDITFFVNGRWVLDSALSTALIQAYRNMIMVGRYPAAALFLELQPEMVDVNVHPAKAEVRFRDQDRVFSAVQRGVRRALMASSPVPDLQPARWTTIFPQPPLVSPDWQMAAEAEDGSDTHERRDNSFDTTPNKPQASVLPSGMLPLLRLVGQIGSTYLVAEAPDGLYLIDQHAAHERILFEKMMAHTEGAIPSQALLQPELVEVPPHSSRALTEQVELLRPFGFDIEPFGANVFRVRSLPVILAGLSPAAALQTLIEDFEEDETPLQGQREARLIARICKRAAIKGGQTLAIEEQKALLLDLESCRSPRTCPHGRPTMIHISIDLLERQFGRRGAR
ncbi:MAG: DNA mismatch repair endonuclease MutL [Leptolinea sp.]|nr:DNA mismatch repair endonuclease MutL [Leptolinea sp.]